MSVLPSPTTRSLVQDIGEAKRKKGNENHENSDSVRERRGSVTTKRAKIKFLNPDDIEETIIEIAEISAQTGIETVVVGGAQ